MTSVTGAIRVKFWGIIVDGLGAFAEAVLDLRRCALLKLWAAENQAGI